MKRTRRNPDVTDTPAFRRWFGDSKVVDALGHPLVVYHGTSSEFWAFDVSAQGRATDAGTLGAGFYFTSSREAAQNYADDAARKYGGEPRVIEAYLSIGKPYRAPRRLWQLSHEPKEARKHSAALRKQGYDGIQFHIDLSAIGDASFDEYVVFKPTQIKSATNNVGTFDPTDLDIRHNPRPARRNSDVTDTPAFRRWFGNSKIIDENGKPLVVYHGGFDVLGSRTGAFRRSAGGELGTGIYFTPDRKVAEYYAQNRGGYVPTEGRVVTEVYLSVANPQVVMHEQGQDPAIETLVLLGLSRKQAETKVERARDRTGDVGKIIENAAVKAGHDGILHYIDGSLYEIVVFQPWQVKSATHNAGTYELFNADIRHNPRRARHNSALTAREVFQAFQDQTDAGDDYFAMFAPYARWTLITIDPATIQSYTEPGAIQHGFKNAGDEATARQYAARGIEHAPPIFVRPYGRDGYAWLHIDGQTRARAAFLSGKPIRAYAPMAIGEVVRKRARHNPDYPNVQVLKGRIVSPEGSIPVRKIGEGAFSTAYLSDERTPRVFVVTSKRAKEKEILAQAYALDPKNPHLPKVSRYGFTKTGKTLWTMPYYTMLPKAKTATAARNDAKALTVCRNSVLRRKAFRPKTSDEVNEAIIHCAQGQLADRPTLIKALDALRWAARLYQTYLFEFQQRNLAVDEHGHLILLDVIFDWKA